MDKKLRLIIESFLFAAAFAAFAGKVYAINSVYIATFTASVTLTYDAVAPEISHVPLERISLVTKEALIAGEATDNHQVKSVNIVYRNFEDQGWSTYTVTAAADLQKAMEFSFVIPQEFIKNNIEYRIYAYDGKNRAIFPSDGSWHAVTLGDLAQKSLGIGGGVISMGGTSLEIPKGALNGTVNISIHEVDCIDVSVPKFRVPAPGAVKHEPVAVYKFEPDKLVFNKLVKMSLLYRDRDNDGIVDGTDYSEDTLKAMWWDGFEWRMLDTIVDKTMNTASSNILHFSYYAIFPVGALTDDDYRPKEKIITPASVDSYNDFANFTMVGPSDVVTIYDVNGRRIRQFTGEKIWDGKDDSGVMADSGMYIYQIKTSDRFISGIIVIAK